MKKFLAEFKEFALRGNVINLAVGVIIGAAFQSVVASFTDNIISPIIGTLAKQNFDKLHVEFLGVTLTYGAFITAIVNFFITAFVVFMLVKGMNRLMSSKKADEPAAPTTKKCPYCKTDIAIAATRCAHCTSELPADDE